VCFPQRCRIWFSQLDTFAFSRKRDTFVVLTCEVDRWGEDEPPCQILCQRPFRSTVIEQTHRQTHTINGLRYLDRGKIEIWKSAAVCGSDGLITDRVSWEGKVIWSVRLSVRLFRIDWPLNLFFACMRVGYDHSSPGIESQDQGNAVTWSVWPQSSTEDNFFSVTKNRVSLFYKQINDWLIDWLNLKEVEITFCWKHHLLYAIKNSNDGRHVRLVSSSSTRLLLLVGHRWREGGTKRAREHKPITGVLGAELPAGSRGRASDRGSGGDAPRSWKLLSIRASNRGDKFANLSVFCEFIL